MLYEMYAPKMKGVCLRYINDLDAVNDVLQEGFLKVFACIKQYNGNGSFEGWLKRIFINTTISYMRKYNHQHINIDDIDEQLCHDSTSIENGEPSGQFNADFVLSAEFSECELLDALKKIPEKYRVVFNLYCIENIKHEEIALILQIDIATSRTRLLRARNIIQKELYTMCLAKISQ
jgi:RNA polymerase sigma-70 factor (ECF subfamily)